MVVKTTTIRDVALELKELDSAQWSKGIKHELLTRSRKAHQAAKDKEAEKKKKSFKDFQSQGADAKKKIRFYDKKGKGYIVKGKKKYD